MNVQELKKKEKRLDLFSHNLNMIIDVYVVAEREKKLSLHLFRSENGWQDQGSESGEHGFLISPDFYGEHFVDLAGTVYLHCGPGSQTEVGRSSPNIS